MCSLQVFNIQRYQSVPTYLYNCGIYNSDTDYLVIVMHEHLKSTCQDTIKLKEVLCAHEQFINLHTPYELHEPTWLPNKKTANIKLYTLAVRFDKLIAIDDENIRTSGCK